MVFYLAPENILHEQGIGASMRHSSIKSQVIRYTVIMTELRERVTDRIALGVAHVIYGVESTFV